MRASALATPPRWGDGRCSSTGGWRTKPSRTALSSTRCSSSASGATEASTEVSKVLRVRVPCGLSEHQHVKLARACRAVSTTLSWVSASDVQCDAGFSVELQGELSDSQLNILLWLLSRGANSKTPYIEPASESKAEHELEVGPRLSFTSALSANATAICAACGLPGISRLEQSRCYVLPTDALPYAKQIAEHLYDPMTEIVYTERIKSFETSTDARTPARIVDVLSNDVDPVAAISHENEELDLGMDAEDMQRYAHLFANTLQRNPTDVELFDIAQSNSEHCRHWFFRGSLSVDNKELDGTLIDHLQATLDHAGVDNSTLAFNDNSSVMDNSTNRVSTYLFPKASCTKEGSEDERGEVPLLVHRECALDTLFTAETHNFPAGVAPFPGAETGTGGRIRDTHATGRGSSVGIATAGYSVGNLNLDDYYIPGEDRGREPIPQSLAHPVQVLIGSSDGASDYGNKFGEPVGAGFCRTVGLRPGWSSDSIRREYLKPIMFSGGLGTMLRENTLKADGDAGFKVVKIGGPAYRIGMGGGAASSKAGGESDKRNLNAVQRGDAEMAQKLNRVVRALAELGASNPIYSIHDQGAGGNCNVVKEIVEPSGASVDVRNIVLGDKTLSALEVWGAEYQENDCLLVSADSVPLVQQICERERLPMSVMGELDGSGSVKVTDAWTRKELNEPDPVVDLKLDDVLGKLPKKHFSLTTAPENEQPTPLQFKSADNQDVRVDVVEFVKGKLHDVLCQPSVCSKRFLTSKVDRSVTGLLTQQQCVGPRLLPIADYAASASTYVDAHGAVTSIGEQPLKGLANPRAMAAMSLGEALTNLAGANIDGLGYVRCSCNWMWAPKLEGEGGSLVDALYSLCDTMKQLGVAVDGGKDSLSMAAAAGGETVRAPGTLVVSAYVTSPDVSQGLTPDVKAPGSSSIVLLDLANGKRRLGGSAFAQSLGQSGSADEMPDMDDPHSLKRALEFIQHNEKRNATLFSVHDVSDGGLVTALLEMAFATSCGIDAELPIPAVTTSSNDEHADDIQQEHCRCLAEAMFAEELGILVEVSNCEEAVLMRELQDAGIAAKCVATTRADEHVSLRVGQFTVLDGVDVRSLQMQWEETAIRLEYEQSATSTVEQEEAVLLGTYDGLQSSDGKRVQWSDTKFLPASPGLHRSKQPGVHEPVVGVLREEGSNGDREMHAAFQAAGLRSADIRMADIIAGRAELQDLSAIAFVGGFSFGDVLGSATGWAASAKYNTKASEALRSFLLDRKDTLSLGVCNGCQLLSLLGIVPQIPGEDPAEQITFGNNDSGRFESRFVTLGVQKGAERMTPWLHQMEGLAFGMWCAHGEGKAESERMDEIVDAQLAPLRYTTPQALAPTEAYPYNPNGSPLGVAGVCSSDGRHLAMMPHPERSFQLRQMAYVPAHFRQEMVQQEQDQCVLKASGLPALSPWQQLFDNAYYHLVRSVE